ncbi:MAG: hypothetical protein J7497_06650 [Chitinophagaceae bacterium]|nr:hypothetical protein [Chitinophagaceae bacterium]
MIYQLGTLDKWIRQDITPEILHPYTEPQLKEAFSVVVGQKEAICGYFRDKAIGKPPTPTTKFIQTHQVGISNLIDMVLSYQGLSSIDLTSPVKEFYEKVTIELEEVMQFLQQNLWEYFDSEMPITQVNASRAKADLQARLRHLDLIEHRPQIDKALYRIATRPLRDFIEENTRITYRDLKYLHVLANELRRLANVDDDTELIYEMHLTLWHLNYNFPRYVLNFNYWLDEQLVRIENRTERVDKLLGYMHDIVQMKVKPGFIFIPELQPLSEQLLASIRTTHQDLLFDNKSDGQEIVEKTANVSKERVKIKLSISVSALALGLKLLMMAGVIVNENKSDVFRTVIDSFTTVKSEELSYDSLRGKFAKTPSVAYSQMKQLLLKMLEILKQF